MSDVKFNTFAVANKKTGAKARVHYSLDNQASGRKVVTVYDRDYGHALSKVFEGVDDVAYKNDTDSMTDYFDKGVVRIYETAAIYAEARKAVEAIIVKEQAKRDARYAARAARRRASVARFAPSSQVLS
jgi:hypothetical protein